ncbi:ComF family protein [Candidatus Magnetaquicoccus inordinatus]|uniref:ComF family protein n=1 Tax=Candidatus Magnetaquicoccus inordinatus TaxID=2496818 RepID=UPI00102C8BDC|nr:ComF family protein [Candidatus Magnetaquicoccus inordinatus]
MAGGWWRRSWRLLMDGMFPVTCLHCGQEMEELDQLCAACMRQLPKQPDRYCMRCGQRTAGVINGCGHCIRNLGRYADATYFAYSYAPPISDWIIGLKFADHTEWAKSLSWLLWQRLQRELLWESVAMVLPVPLHPWRLLRRGYNQSALLAGGVAAALGVPLRTGVLQRIKRTKPQTSLNAWERAENVKDAFRADREVSGQDLLLIDDVFTTGATVHSAVRALKLAGARRVVVACVAAVHAEEVAAPVEAMDYSIPMDSRSR